MISLIFKCANLLVVEVETPLGGKFYAHNQVEEANLSRGCCSNARPLDAFRQQRGSVESAATFLSLKT